MSWLVTPGCYGCTSGSLVDRSTSCRLWTGATLRTIADQPGRRAADLAAAMGRERDDGKRDVRKLKALGLTLSLEVGYRLSPRGETYLRASGRP